MIMYLQLEINHSEEFAMSSSNIFIIFLLVVVN